jgi:hypothetical protein
MVDRHEHNGTDAPRIPAKNLLGAPTSALTAADGGTLSSGGTEDMTDADAAILNNLLTRFAEMEARLQSLGLLS